MFLGSEQNKQGMNRLIRLGEFKSFLRSSKNQVKTFEVFKPDVGYGNPLLGRGFADLVS